MPIVIKSHSIHHTRLPFGALKCLFTALRAIASTCGKDFVYFTLKTYFFYFIPSLLQNIHISLSILQDISIKIFILLNFFDYFSQLPCTYALSLSLSTHFFSDLLLSLSLSISISLPISIPISEHRSHLPLGLIHTFLVRSP